MSAPPAETVIDAPHLPWRIHTPAGPPCAPGVADPPPSLAARDPTRAPTVAEARAATAALDGLRALLDRGRAADDGHPLTDVVHVDLVGAAPGVALLLDALAEDADGRPRGLVPHRLDHPDPAGWRRLLGRLAHHGRLATTLVVVVDPAGDDPTTDAAVATIGAALAGVRVEPGSRLVAVVRPGTPRHVAAARWRARLDPSPGVPAPWATLTPAGLATVGFAGADVDRVLDGARALDAWALRPDGPAAAIAAAGGLGGEAAALRALDGLSRALGLADGPARVGLRGVDDHALGGVVALVEHAAWRRAGRQP